MSEAKCASGKEVIKCLADRKVGMSRQESVAQGQGPQVGHCAQGSMKSFKVRVIDITVEDINVRELGNVMWSNSEFVHYT